MLAGQKERGVEIRQFQSLGFRKLQWAEGHLPVFVPLLNIIT